MKKILIIHNILWSHYKAVVLTELNTLIRNNGDELLVIHIAPKGIAQKNLGNADLDLHQYPYKVIFNEDYEIPISFKKSIALSREIFLYKPDVVIQPGFGETPFWFSLLTTKLLRIPSIFCCDSTAMDNPKHWLKDTLKKIYVKGCVSAFTYGTKSKEYILSLGMIADQIYTHCQAATNIQLAAAYEPAHIERQSRISAAGFNTHNFIYVGRLTSIKNINRLITAFLSLKNNNALAKDWGLILVGDGPQRRELTQLCVNMDAKDVHFVGGKSWREVPEFHALADVFVLPSTSEPWGIVVNEAMVCGLPVLVSSHCGAAYDLVQEGENGFMFDPYNEQELLDKLNFFVNHPNELTAMGIKSREIIEQFSPKNV